MGKQGPCLLLCLLGRGPFLARGLRDTIGLGKGAVVLVVVVSAGTAAISGKGMRDTICVYICIRAVGRIPVPY